MVECFSIRIFGLNAAKIYRIVEVGQSLNDVSIGLAFALIYKVTTIFFHFFIPSIKIFRSSRIYCSINLVEPYHIFRAFYFRA